MMNTKDKELFDSLCAAESYRARGVDAERGIGVYNEKRIHRILKETFCEHEDCFEVKVGRYIADIALDGRVIEIQCGPLTPLKSKIEYYLKSTELDVCVVLPIIAKRTIIRAERETGEILRVRTSPKRQSEWNALAKLYPIRHLLRNERLTVKVMLIEAEEYRYSEAVRYRKKGKYDSELFPTALVGSVEFRGKSDYKRFVPDGLDKNEFSAADFTAHTPLRGRDVYSALNTLAELGLLGREKQGRAVRYSVRLD